MTSSSGRGSSLRNVIDEGDRRPRRRFQLVGEVIGELSRVTWPSTSVAVRLSFFVIAIAVAVGAFLAIWDEGFGQLAERLLF